MIKRKSRGQAGGAEPGDVAKPVIGQLPYSSESKLFARLFGVLGVAILVAGLLVLVANDGTEKHASVYTPVEDLAFADSVLRSCVLEEASRQGWKVSGEMTELHCANPESRKIVRLDGIQNLVNLETLNLAHNSLTDTRPLAMLSRLVYLDLGYNQIRSPALETLRLNLRSVNLDHNDIKRLDWVAPLLHLESLSVGSNDIDDMSPLASLAHLRTLNVENNRVSDLRPLADLTMIEVLTLDENRVTDLQPVAGLTSLLVLGVANNRISDLGPLSGHLRLYELNIANNKITQVDALAGDESLTLLDLSGLQIEDLSPLQNLGELKSVILAGNRQLSCEDVERLAHAIGQESIRHDLDCPDGA